MLVRIIPWSWKLSVSEIVNQIIITILVINIIGKISITIIRVML